MKPFLNSIPLLTGYHKPGLSKVQIVPKEHVAQLPNPSFINNVIETPAALIAGKSFITLEFTPNSYSYISKPKTNKNGSYNEVTVKGTLNNIIPNIQMVLEQLRYHEVCCACTDNRNRKRFIGNTSRAMQLTYSEENDAKEQALKVELNFDTEEAPPFYIDNHLTASDLNAIHSNSGNNNNNPSSNVGNFEIVDFNTNADTVINWTSSKILQFGMFPSIEVWPFDGNQYYLGNIPIDAIGSPPTQFIIRNAGGLGKIKIS